MTGKAEQALDLFTTMDIDDLSCSVSYLSGVIAARIHRQEPFANLTYPPAVQDIELDCLALRVRNFETAVQRQIERARN